MMVYRWVALAWAPAVVCGGRELPTNSRGSGARLPAAPATKLAAASEEDHRAAEMMATFILSWLESRRPLKSTSLLRDGIEIHVVNVSTSSFSLEFSERVRNQQGALCF